MIKATTKKLGITINDFVLCALTTALNQVFTEKGEKVKDIQIACPANIRFRFYKSAREIKLENKFAAMVIKAPMTEAMENSYEKIKQVTKQLKISIGYMYAVYALSFWSGKLLPRFINYQGIESITDKFTIGFTNNAGPIKPMVYTHEKTGKVAKNIASQSYVIFSGRVGMCMCVVTTNGFLRLTLCSQDNVCDEMTTQRIVKLTHENLEKEIERVKSD